MGNKTISKKRLIINAAIIIVVAALTFYYLLRNNFLTRENLSKLTVFSFIVCFAVFLFSEIIVGLTEHMVFETFTPLFTVRKSIANSFFGNFGSNITPFKAGHFPMMAYFQVRSEIPPRVTVIGFLKNQIIFSGVSILVYGAFTVYLFVSGVTAEVDNHTVALWIVVFIGFVFHLGTFTFITIISYNKRIQSAVLSFTVKIIKKFNKNFDAGKFALEKELKLEEFKNQVSVIGKNFSKFIIPALLYAVHMLLSGSLQYIAYLFVTGAGFSINAWFTFYILNLASTYIGNVIPLPGGAGTAEVLFSLVFAGVVPDSAMGATIVLWRVSSFYLPIILEFIMFFVFSLKRKKSNG